MPDVTFEDVTRALEERAPDFAERVIALLEQPDPPEDRPEVEAEDSQTSWPPLPEGTWTLARLKRTIAPDRMAEKTPTERKNLRREAFEGLLAAPYPPPRFRLGALLPALYDADDEWSRNQLMAIFKSGRLGFGVWQAFKAVYKRAEAKHDAAMFGVLAYRLDAYSRTPHTKEIGPGTIKYMRRRAWRYLRLLGQAVPDLFPLFAVQVLKHYPASFRFNDAWVAHQIWAHEDLIGADEAFLPGPPDNLERRAFNDAWKLHAEPLLRLLEDAEHDAVGDFAVRSLRADFPERLRAVDAAWLKRIGRKRSASVHTFLVEALNDSPEFHQSRLRALGLHRTVLDLLKSNSLPARTYAIRYAEAHAPDIEVSELVELARDGTPDVRQFVVSRLSDVSGADIGLAPLIMLVGVREAEAAAKAKIQQSYAPADLDPDLFVRLAGGRPAQRRFVAEWHEATKTSVPTGHWLTLLEHRDADAQSKRSAVVELDARPGGEIGIDWFKRALADTRLRSHAARWLRAGKLAGDDLDVEWVKGLVLRQSQRSLALELLANRRLVSPDRVGLSWLLVMARHTDEAVARFAHRYLLENFTPDDFDGIDRIWSLAVGKKEPESVRRFAQTYLKVHHPDLGPTTSDATELGVKPRLSSADYPLARVRPLFDDDRPDVRQLAVAVARFELVRWGSEPDDPESFARTLLYRLADARHREPRAFAAEVLVAIGDPMADPTVIPPVAWLDADQIFALAESALRPARETRVDVDRHPLRADRGAGAARVADGESRSRSSSVRGASVVAAASSAARCPPTGRLLRPHRTRRWWLPRASTRTPPCVSSCVRCCSGCHRGVGLGKINCIRRWLEPCRPAWPSDA